MSIFVQCHRPITSICEESLRFDPKLIKNTLLEADGHYLSILLGHIYDPASIQIHATSNFPFPSTRIPLSSSCHRNWDTQKPKEFHGMLLYFQFPISQAPMVPWNSMYPIPYSFVYFICVCFITYICVLPQGAPVLFIIHPNSCQNPFSNSLVLPLI